VGNPWEEAESNQLRGRAQLCNWGRRALSSQLSGDTPKVGGYEAGFQDGDSRDAGPGGTKKKTTLSRGGGMKGLQMLGVIRDV